MGHNLETVFSYTWFIYVYSNHLAIAQQSDAKDPFYSTVYYITLNSNYHLVAMLSIFHN
jgi:hypothetical protein